MWGGVWGGEFSRRVTYRRVSCTGGGGSLGGRVPLLDAEHSPPLAFDSLFFYFIRTGAMLTLRLSTRLSTLARICRSRGVIFSTISTRSPVMAIAEIQSRNETLPYRRSTA